jgi:predicted membrane protein
MNWRRVFVGALLLALGVSLVLVRSDTLGISWLRERADWPLGLVAFGILVLVVPSRRAYLLAGVLILIGLILLVQPLDLAPMNEYLNTQFGAQQSLWPAVIITAGLLLFVHFGSSHRRSQRHAAAVVYGFSFFTTHRVTAHGTSMSRAVITPILGTVVLDLRDSVIHDNGVRVDVTAVFGRAVIQIPQDWQVSLSGLPIFGVFEDTRMAREAASTTGPRLLVKATVFFSGVHVESVNDVEEGGERRRPTPVAQEQSLKWDA